MGIENTPLQVRTVVRQTNEPVNTSVLWLDSSFDPAVLKTYNSATQSWEPVASSVVTKQDTPPQTPVDGDMWQDTSVSPSVIKTYESSSGTWVNSIAHSDIRGVSSSDHHGHNMERHTFSVSSSSNGTNTVSFNNQYEYVIVSTGAASKVGSYVSSYTTSGGKYVSVDISYNNTSGGNRTVYVEVFGRL